MTAASTAGFRTALAGRIKIDGTATTDRIAVLPVPDILEVTGAEFRILEAFLGDGADNETIARRCGLARDTVKTHFHRIMRRADVPNRTALAVLILTGQKRVRTVRSPVEPL